jgi:prefoldin subunit 5
MSRVRFEPSSAEELEALHVGLQRDVERKSQLTNASERCNAQLQSYQRLDATLSGITTLPRHRVFAPVCGGLAYFEAELVDCNKLLVLLGESIFAERTAAQTREVCGRRVAFLIEEAAGIATELEAVESRIAAAPSAFTAGDAQSIPEGTFNAGRGDDGEDEAAEGAADDGDDIDDADLLTPEELEEIEEALGEDVEDEEKAEAALKAAVERKRSARQAREQNARAASSVVAASMTTRVSYQHPGDIGMVTEVPVRPKETHAEVEPAAAPRATVAIGDVAERGATERRGRLRPMGATSAKRPPGGR